MTDTLVERLLEEMDASPVDDVTCINRAELTQLGDRIIVLEADVARLREALVQHNELLRSAHSIASRDGKDTNWKTFRGQCTYTLAEYHELVNECRAALEVHHGAK